jgi:hypothetical protein
MATNKLKKTFSKPPLSPTEKEKRAQEIMEGVDKYKNEGESVIGKARAFQLRMPESYYKDLIEIKKLSGVTINGICLELLRPAIKQRLKEIRETKE